jgi:hypothetical protein
MREGEEREGGEEEGRRGGQKGMATTIVTTMSRMRNK